ncbi:MAG TPA: glycoside hydrolase family 2 TIM barrel-domain containing protein [Armatimonadota bacterium]|jgi:hypothetical protein
MRDMQCIQGEWWVSASAADAVLAASGKAWTAADLEYADDPENHPQCIDLPGGTQYGKRAERSHGKTLAHGSGTKEEGQRLPTPFLSYAKRVAIPAEYQGQRIFLTLDMTRYHVTVSIDGRQLAHYVGGLEPHRFDITEYVTPGEDALLLITVGDTGVSGKRQFDPYNYTGTRLPTCKEIENNLAHPVNYGGADRAVGKVTVEALPPVRVEYVFAQPRVSRGELDYLVVVTNDSAEKLDLHVKSEVPGTKTLIEETVTLKAKSTMQLQATVSWPDAILWDLDTPHLYDLVTTLTVGEDTLDVHHDYFGFREFTINGHSFYLNGKKIHLYGNSGHVGPKQHAMSLEEKIAFLRAWKDQGHIVHIRLHARPQDKRWVEAADRVGMLITTETALWTTGFHSFDWVDSEEACRENVATHFLEALVRRDRNNPSVVIWSLSNEMSPITPGDLRNPKMAAMTRVFKAIIAQTAREDDTRIIQMSSAMDFIGNLAMYNLHYPKGWQAYPDYPNTAYWLDSSFLFHWYGPSREEMPAWSWRKDKPLFLGEFLCIYGATPDNISTLIGERAFENGREDGKRLIAYVGNDHDLEEFDGGLTLANAKTWAMEVQAYRRQDVSGFCAWAFVLGDEPDVQKMLARPDVAAHTQAIRPLAVLDHGYRTQYFSRDDIAMPLSIHNDTRQPRELALRCEILRDGQVIAVDVRPAAVYGPAENLTFTNRFRAPEVTEKSALQYRATLTSGKEIVDQWTKTLTIRPKAAEQDLPEDCAFYDPQGTLAAVLAQRGLAGATCLRSLDPLALGRFRALWLDFQTAGLRLDDWQQIRQAVSQFARDGGCVILDHPPLPLDGLPIDVQNFRGFAEDDRLEITYAYPGAPHHPVTKPFSEEDFALWGDDYYVARRCYETPQEGNALPLLLAGRDSLGLTATPLLEIRYGAGSYLVTSLEIFPKLLEEPRASDVLAALAAYRPQRSGKQVGVCLAKETMGVLRQVGYLGENSTLGEALQAELALIDGSQLDSSMLPKIGAMLTAGKTVYLHGLEVEQTRGVLAALGLPGEVVDGAARPREFDTVRHTHPLTDGLANNYLYWIVDKALVPPWTQAPLHPRPATALIKLGAGTPAVQLTQRGAVTVYSAGTGTLIIDNLQWQLPGFDEPERPRRYATCLLTNLGVPLTRGVEKRMAEDFETAEDRRERGFF